MITKSTHKLSPDTKIIINGVSVNYASISGFTIQLTENEHDFATITIAGAPEQSVTDFFNAAVYLLIDSGIGRRQEFFGYVTGVEPVSSSNLGPVNGSYIQELRLQCLGASMLLKDVDSRVWDLPTLSNIVSELGSKYRISADYPTDSFRPTRLTQSNESDWAFLRRVVERYGYAMSMHGTHLRIWDITQSVRRLPSYHDLISPGTYTGEHPGAVIKFQSQMGHMSLKGDTSRVTNTTLDSQGRIVETSADFSSLQNTRAVTSSLFTTPIKEVFQTEEESMRAIEAKQRNQTLYKAVVEITAGAGVVPGGIVNIVGYGGEIDGLWYVHEVLHKMSTSMYTTELEIHKNSNRSDDLANQVVTVFKSPPATVLENGVWVARDRKVEQYA